MLPHHNTVLEDEFECVNCAKMEQQLTSRCSSYYIEQIYMWRKMYFVWSVPVRGWCISSEWLRPIANTRVSLSHCILLKDFNCRPNSKLERCHCEQIPVTDLSMNYSHNSVKVTSWWHKLKEDGKSGTIFFANNWLSHQLYPYAYHVYSWHSNYG